MIVDFGVTGWLRCYAPFVTHLHSRLPVCTGSLHGLRWYFGLVTLGFDLFTRCVPLRLLEPVAVTFDLCVVIPRTLHLPAGYSCCCVVPRFVDLLRWLHTFIYVTLLRL